MAWFDRSGRELERADKGEPANANNIALSPTADRVAVGRGTRGGVLVLQLARGTLNRVLREGNLPIWSPDGRRMVVAKAGATEILDLYLVAADGSGEKSLITSSQSKTPTDWSTDGRYVLYRSIDPLTQSDVCAIDLDDRTHTIEVARSEAFERDGQFSPDGRWVAFESDRSGRPEIYLQPFGRPGPSEPVSTNGGSQVRWRRDGKELYYIDGTGTLTAVKVSVDADGMRFGSAQRLFAIPVLMDGPGTQQYARRPTGCVSS